MNQTQTHVMAAAAGATAMGPLSIVIMYLMTWPLKPPSGEEAAAIASVVLPVLSGLLARFGLSSPPLPSAPGAPQ